MLLCPQGCSIWTGGECGTARFGFGSGNGKGNVCRSYRLHECTGNTQTLEIFLDFLPAKPGCINGGGAGDFET